MKERKRNWKEQQSLIRENAKTFAPDENAINLANEPLSNACKSLLAKGPSFIPTPYDINWYKLKQDFDSFVNKLRYHANKYISNDEHDVINDHVEINNDTLDKPPPRQLERVYNFRLKPTAIHSLEGFIESLEKDIFRPTNYNKIFSNITKEERTALKEITNWENKCVRVQDKGSRFVIIGNEEYCNKINTQIDRSSFVRLSDDVTTSFNTKVLNWIAKWSELEVLNEDWKRYITPINPRPGKMYGLIKTHKDNNPTRVITSGCGTAVENLSIFVEKLLYKEVKKISTRIKDTPHMLSIIDDINNSDILNDNSILVSFDVVNMFPSIDNNSGMKAVAEVLNLRDDKTIPTECILEALRLCLESNNSIFNHIFYLQVDGTAQGPHMSCSYSDIAMYKYDCKAISHNPSVSCWNRFRDDVFAVWNHSRNELDEFLVYLNGIDPTNKIKFTMSVADHSGLEFLDLKLSLMVENIIRVDVFSKPTNSFTYVLPSTCYPKRNIENVPKGVALRLRRICDTDEKFDIRSAEYQKYLIARDYRPSLVKKQFESVKNISRSTARQPKTMTASKSLGLVTQYNPILTNLSKTIGKYLPMLYSDPNMKLAFPEGTIKATYRRGKNLKEMISPSLFPISTQREASRIFKCGKRCDVCSNYLVIDDNFVGTATGKKYKIRGQLSCNSINIIYLITCSACNDQYVGSAVKFKERFRVHKSDITTGKDRCGVAKHFITKCQGVDKLANLKVQLIEQIVCDNKNLESRLWSREKYWQAQLFTTSHGMNCSWDWYSTNRKGYRKK